jgi:hypothetical protein
MLSVSQPVGGRVSSPKDRAGRKPETRSLNPAGDPKAEAEKKPKEVLGVRTQVIHYSVLELQTDSNGLISRLR